MRWLPRAPVASSAGPGTPMTIRDYANSTATPATARFSHPGAFARFFASLQRHLIPASALSETATDLERSGSRAGSTSNIVITQVQPGSGNRLLRRTSKRSTVADEEEIQREKQGLGVEFDDRVNVVVVDADFDTLIQRGTLGTDSETAIDDGMTSNIASQIRPRTATSASAHPYDHPSEQTGWQGRLNGFLPYTVLRWRIIPFIWHFFDPAFMDGEKEFQFQREKWFTLKPSALVISLFYIVIWAVIFGLSPEPFVSYTTYYYGVLSGILMALPFPLVALDAPRRQPYLWQFALWLASWCLSAVTVFDVWHCGYYTATPHCGHKTFVGILFYPTALPALALFCLGQNRFAHLCGVVFYISILAALLVPLHAQFASVLVNLLLFHAACLWADYLRGRADRKMFALRDQLKQQYRATQKAQVAERQAADSKRRFVSHVIIGYIVSRLTREHRYIFHEARVPLNTALIALQNLEGENALSSIPDDSRELVTALSSSLVLMEKVLNDVLDFNRMEAGRLVIQNKPFEFHKPFRAVALAFRGAADARQITLVEDLDPAIDEYCPIIKGDETRLLQILSNLLSNATKFTPSGGRIRYATRLLYPTPEVLAHRRSTSTKVDNKPLGPPDSNSQDHESLKGQRSPMPQAVTPPEPDFAILRFEVEDSGVGIRRKDLEDKSLRLFSPYVQTEIGQRQGGKGSGLGLALIRQVIKLSGGRLGVCSQLGKGSQFWCELIFQLPESSSTPLNVSTPPIPSATDAMHTPRIGTLARRSDIVAQAELAVAQLPVVQDPEGVPVEGLPAPTALLPTPNEDDPYKHLHCLVVDDDALTRKLMARMLTRLGHDVETAENGLVALNLLRQAHDENDEFRYQVVFLDNQMPLCTGVEVVRTIRQMGMRVWVAGLTGNALADDQTEYLEAGLSKIMTKPLLERALRATLDEARADLRLLNGRPARVMQEL